MITTLWAATEPGLTTVADIATTVANMVGKIAVPIVLLVAAGQLAIRAITGQLTAGGFIRTAATAGACVAMLWTLPTLMTSAMHHGPASQTDSTPTASPPPPSPTPTPSPTPAAPVATPDQPTDWT